MSDQRPWKQVSSLGSHLGNGPRQSILGLRIWMNGDGAITALCHHIQTAYKQSLVKSDGGKGLKTLAPKMSFFLSLYFICFLSLTATAERYSEFLQKKALERNPLLKTHWLSRLAGGCRGQLWDLQNLNHFQFSLPPSRSPTGVRSCEIKVLF